MTKMLVVGTGSMGWNHVRVCSELGFLAGVCDNDSESSKTVGEEFGVPYFTSVEEAIEDCRPDGVIIATPTSSHHQIALSALTLGAHVLVEKPITNDCATGREIIDKSEKLGLICGVGHIERFNPVIKRCKKMIDDGELGEVITISSRRVSNFPGRIRDVGVILDLGIHDIDNSIFLMGCKPVSVFCSGGTHNEIEYEDHVTIMILFENGKSAVIEVNWITPLKVRKISLTCEKAFAELDYMDQTITVSSSKYIDPDDKSQYPARIEFETRNLPVIKNEPLKLEIEDFISAMNGEKEIGVSGKDGLLALKVARAAEESLSKGEVINIE